MAEVTAVRFGGTAVSMREKKAAVATSPAC